MNVPLPPGSLPCTRTAIRPGYEHRDITQAIANLEITGMRTAGAFWVLNAYRWWRRFS